MRALSPASRPRPGRRRCAAAALLALAAGAPRGAGAILGQRWYGGVQGGTLSAAGAHSERLSASVPTPVLPDDSAAPAVARLLRFGRRCNASSWDEGQAVRVGLGTGSTGVADADTCAQLCHGVEGCRFFEFTSSGPDRGGCWWLRTLHESCEGRWEFSYHTSFYAVEPPGAPVLFDGLPIAFYCHGCLRYGETIELDEEGDYAEVPPGVLGEWSLGSFSIEMEVRVARGALAAPRGSSRFGRDLPRSAGSDSAASLVEDGDRDSRVLFARTGAMEPQAQRGDSALPGVRATAFATGAVEFRLDAGDAMVCAPSTVSDWAEWHHLAFSKSGTKLTLKVDGSSQCTHVVTQAPLLPVANVQLLHAYVPGSPIWTVDANTTLYCPDAAFIGETLGEDQSVEDCAARCFAFRGSSDATQSDPGAAVQGGWDESADYRSRQCRVFRFETESARANHLDSSRRLSRCSLYTHCDSWNATTEKDGRGTGLDTASYPGGVYGVRRQPVNQDRFVFLGGGECRGPNPPGVPSGFPGSGLFEWDYSQIPHWVFPEQYNWYVGTQVPGHYINWEGQTASECKAACAAAGYECMGYAHCETCTPAQRCIIYAAAELSDGIPSGFGAYHSGSGTWIATYDHSQGYNNSGWACYARPTRTKVYLWSGATDNLGWVVTGGDSALTYGPAWYTSRVHGMAPVPWTVDARDRVGDHAAVLVQSPPFCHPREISFQLMGGLGDLVWVDQNRVPVVPGQPGFLGVALRDLATDKYVRYQRNDKYREEFKTHTWDLGAGLSGCYTLDLIDAANGWEAWAAIQNVHIVHGVEPFCELVSAVRVRAARTGGLNVTELQIYDDKWVNVGLATNGGVASAAYREWDSSVLNDGNATSLHDPHLEAPLEGSAPWIRVDLLQPKPVMKVVVVTPSEEHQPLIIELLASGVVIRQVFAEVASYGTNETYAAVAQICDAASAGANVDNDTAAGDDAEAAAWRCVDGVRAGGPRHVCGLAPTYQGRGDPYVKLDMRYVPISAGSRVRRSRAYHGGSDGRFSGTEGSRVWDDYPTRGSEDGGGVTAALGTVTRFVSQYVVEVRWDHDQSLGEYRWGLGGLYDLEIVPLHASDRRTGNNASVEFVRIYPRRDCCHSDLHVFQVWVGMNGDAPSASGNTMCYNGTADSDDVTVDAPCGASGRYVYVLLPGGDRDLGLMEVEVHAPASALTAVSGIGMLTTDHYDPDWGYNATLERHTTTGDFDAMACSRLPVRSISIYTPSCDVSSILALADSPVPSPRQACEHSSALREQQNGSAYEMLPCDFDGNWTAPTNITEWPSLVFMWDTRLGNAKWVGGGYDLQAGDPHVALKDRKDDHNSEGVHNCSAAAWHTLRRVAPAGAGGGSVEVLVDGAVVHTFAVAAPGPLYGCALPLDTQELPYVVDVCGRDEVWCAGLPFEKAPLLLAAERPGVSAAGDPHGDGITGDMRKVRISSDTSRQRSVDWAASLEHAHPGGGQNYTALASCASPAMLLTFQRADGTLRVDELQAKFVAEADIYVSLYFMHRAGLPWLLHHGWSPVTLAEARSQAPTMDGEQQPAMIATKSFVKGQWVELYGNGDPANVPGSSPYAACVTNKETVTPSTSHYLTVFEGFEKNIGDCGNIETANVPDFLRSASSVLSNHGLGTGHNQGRLYSLQAWTAGTNLRGEFYELTAGRTLGGGGDWLRGQTPSESTYGQIGLRIAGVVIQGRKVGIESQSQWVTRFSVKRSHDKVNWWDVDRGRAFIGNYDHSTPNFVYFSEPVWAKYIRIYPIEWHNAISLRAALLVCNGGLPSYTGFYENFTSEVHRCAVDLDNADANVVEGNGSLRLSAGYTAGPLAEWLGVALTQAHTGLTEWLLEHPLESWVFRDPHLHYDALSNGTTGLGEACAQTSVEADFSAYDIRVSRTVIWGKVDSVAGRGAWRFEYSHFRSDGGTGTVVFETGPGGAFYANGYLGGGVTAGQWFCLTIEAVADSSWTPGNTLHSLNWSLSGSAPRQAELSVGCRVEVHSVVAARFVHLNGMEGTVLRRISLDHWVVRFDDPRAGTRGMPSEYLRPSEDEVLRAPPRGRGTGEVVVVGWTSRLSRVRLVKDYPHANAWFDGFEVWGVSPPSPALLSFDDPALLSAECPQYLGYNTSGDFTPQRLTAAPRPHLQEAACIEACCQATWCTGIVVGVDNITRGCQLLRDSFADLFADPTRPPAGRYDWWQHRFLLKLAEVTAGNAPVAELSELELRAQPWEAGAPHDIDWTHTSPRGKPRWGMPDGWGGGATRTGSSAPPPVPQAMSRGPPHVVVEYELLLSGAATGATAEQFRRALASSRTSAEEPSGFESLRDCMLPANSVTISRRPAPHPNFHYVHVLVRLYSCPGYHITTDETLSWDNLPTVFASYNVSIYSRGGAIVGAALLPVVKLRAAAPCDGQLSCSGNPCTCGTISCSRAYVCGCASAALVLPLGAPQLSAGWRIGDQVIVSRDEAYVRLVCSDGDGNAKWEDPMLPYLGSRATVRAVLSSTALQLYFSDGYLQAFPVAAVVSLSGLSVCKFHRRPEDWTFDVNPFHPPSFPAKYPYYH
eukprot:TRINITY_DN65061_c0_g1_i1.p1 TRINITY_DN65061_c0_g1~~TRINITY_DN65061_c0_g1_i1.p1  ORF type:complete len:2569 (+),score=758.73 TRINITY_DN65061_c0_g1_i1:58-7764(+)